MYLATHLSTIEMEALTSALTAEGRAAASTLERSRLVSLGFLRQVPGGFQITKLGRLKLRDRNNRVRCARDGGVGDAELN